MEAVLPEVASIEMIQAKKERKKSPKK